MTNIYNKPNTTKWVYTEHNIFIKSIPTHGVAVQKEETMSMSSILHGQVEGMHPVQICHFLNGSQETR